MESINFVLKTTDINLDNTPATYYTKTFTNNLGSVAQNRTSFIWNNVNLRTILGEMYDRYDKFNISLNFIAGGATGTSAETISDFRNFYVKFKGLNFSTTYNQSTQNNCDSVILTSIQVPLTASTAWLNNYFTQQYFTFSKAEISSINIDLLNIYNDSYYIPSDANHMVGHIIFSFNIYGCEDYKNIKNNANTNLDLDLRKIF